MKSSIKNNPQLLAFLQSRVEFQRADLFVIQMANGQAITATDWQIDILNAGAPPQTYFASAFGRWSRGPIRSEATFQPTANEMELTVTIPNAEQSFTNMLARSTEFDNAIWNKASAVVTANTIADRFGVLKADAVVFSGGAPGNAFLVQKLTPVLIPGQQYTFSIWLKCDSGTPTINVMIEDIFAVRIAANFLATLNQTWQRFSTTMTVVSGATGINCFIFNASDQTKTYHFDDAQLETGAFPTLNITTGATPVTLQVPSAVNYPGTNVPLMQTVATGLFDKAQVWVYTAYAPLDPNVFNRHANGFDTSLGLEMKWMGDITGLKSLDRSKAVFSCNDLTYRLNQQTPQAIIQSPCLNTLFDAHCALNSALFSTGAQVAASSTQLVLNTNIALPGIGTNPLPYPLGVIRFTSGANLGLGAKIKAQNSTTQIVLDAPFIFPVNVGDQFIITPGCDQLQSTCSNTFGNLIHFRGFPFTPQPEVVL